MRAVARRVVLPAARRALGSVQLNGLARLLPVAGLVQGTQPSGSLLDVGSGSRGLARWVPSTWRTTAVDVGFDDYGAVRRFGERRAVPVQADVRRLPFRDAAFDVVTAVDLLEHVAPAARAAAVTELVRVARRRVIVAVPAGAAADGADRRLAGMLRRRGRELPGWLEEHLANGAPTLDDLHRWLAPYGDIAVAGSLNVDAHVAMVLRDLSVPAFIPTRLAAAALGAAYRAGGRWRTAATAQQSRLTGHDRAPVYRAICCLDLSPPRERARTPRAAMSG